MKVEVTKTDDWECEVTAELPPERLRNKTDRELQNLRKNLKLPGFRQGRVPMEIVRSRFEASVERDVINTLIPEVIDDALRENNFEAIKVTEMGDLNIEEDKTLTFKAKVEVRPQIIVGNMEELEGVKEVFEVTDQEVEDALHDLRQRYTVEQKVNREAQVGDVLNTDLQKLDKSGVPIIGQKSENVRILLNDENPAWEDISVLEGAKAGDERRILLADNEEEHETGIKQAYMVTVKEVYEREVPEPDNEFASSVGDYKTIDELKKYIRESSEAERDRLSTRHLEETLINEILKKHPFELPPSMIERYLDNFIKNMKEQTDNEIDEGEVRKTQRASAIHSIKRFLMLEAIQKEHNITVSNDEIDKEINGLAQSYKANPKTLKQRLMKEGQYQDIGEQIKVKKTLELLITTARVTEKKIKQPVESRIIKP